MESVTLTDIHFVACLFLRASGYRPSLILETNIYNTHSNNSHLTLLVIYFFGIYVKYEFLLLTENFVRKVGIKQNLFDNTIMPAKFEFT